MAGTTAAKRAAKPTPRKRTSKAAAPKAEAQPKAEVKLDAKTVEEVNRLMASTDVKEKAKVLEMAKAEHAAVKEARKTGADRPATPVLDYMNSSEYRQRKANGNGRKSGGSSGGGKAVNLSDEQIGEVVRELIGQGITTPGGMLKALRGTPRGTNQKRLYRIALPIIEAERKAGRISSEPKAKPAAKATGGKAPAKAAAKRSAAKVESPSDIGRKAAASKAIAQRRSTSRKAS